MQAFLDFAQLRRPSGLAARAVVFTTGLLVLTAVLSAGTIMFGAERESARHQLSVTGDLTEHLSSVAGNLIAQDNLAELDSLAAIFTTRHEVQHILVRDAQGGLLAEHGRTAAIAPVLTALASDVAANGAPSVIRTHGALILGAPIMRNGLRLGVVAVAWDEAAYRFDALPALAPFFLILLCLTLAAVPLTAHVVRRAMAPLSALVEFAQRTAERGQGAEPISIRSGDEFETLAHAFNEMVSRIDASVRRIQEIAFVDPVTQLPNQDRFAREVDFFILRGKQSAAVAVFNLQRLPRLVQTLDQPAARDLLRLIADRMNMAARTIGRSANAPGSDAPLLSRLSASEFAMLIPAVQSDALRLAHHLRAALNQPFEWRGHKLTLDAVCGVALAPRDGRDAETVIRHARMALAAAHEAPERLRLYTQSLDREAMAKLNLEREMRGALERNEFRAFFQPKINLATGRVEACEALARWVRPDRTIISPGRFIPVAEESGLIGALSDAIMREACWKAAAWARAGHACKVAVNVSALQFRSDRFAEQVLRILQHAGLRPEQLELEITESMAMEDPDRALRLIRPLREAGVRLAIDDFGCGHSSLAALSRLPFDVIKIDQQFVRALERGDPQAGAIVEMILALARTLGMEIVAEGLERREEAEFMTARGCHWAQGFLYGAAVSAQEFAEMLHGQSGGGALASNAA